ncbi:MAG TPA: hypothetical protein VF524_00090, partial [Polyangia bacterium]
MGLARKERHVRPKFRDDAGRVDPIHAGNFANQRAVLRVWLQLVFYTRIQLGKMRLDRIEAFELQSQEKPVVLLDPAIKCQRITSSIGKPFTECWFGFRVRGIEDVARMNRTIPTSRSLICLVALMPSMSLV